MLSTLSDINPSKTVNRYEKANYVSICSGVLLFNDKIPKNENLVVEITNNEINHETCNKIDKASISETLVAENGNNKTNIETSTDIITNETNKEENTEELNYSTNKNGTNLKENTKELNNLPSKNDTIMNQNTKELNNSESKNGTIMNQNTKEQINSESKNGTIVNQNTKEQNNSESKTETNMKENTKELISPSKNNTDMKEDTEGLENSMTTSTRPKSCRDVKSTQDRVVVTLASGLEVMCDTTTSGGGWTIIQRRVSGKYDFYRNWESYREGFGNYIDGEFYLGNENIFRLTTSIKHELRVDIEYQNRKYFAQYALFRLSNEQNKYQLQIGNYSGNAGDSLIRHDKMYFSTFDRDNDRSTQNCANYCHGAWWYAYCADSNLNGDWLKSYRRDGFGAYWKSVTWRESVTFSEMKIREIN